MDKPSATPWTDAVIQAYKHEPGAQFLPHVVSQLRRIEREHSQMLDVLKRIRIALAEIMPEDKEQI
jgi:hypothetical protein